MKLQTQILLEKQSERLIDYKSNVLLLGSCFSENIGDKLSYFKFQSLQNPFGILFHPKAIETLIFNAVSGKKYSKADVFQYNEQWHCFDAHSKLSNSSKEALLSVLNLNVQSTYQQLNKASHIIITLGTAWVYRFVQSDHIVANCHKIPQKQFKKELLSVEEIVSSLSKTVELIRSIKSKVPIIFTVSPVRHLKDGFVENTQSKAHLITGIHQYLKSESFIENNQSSYFPSYEIMMDELRDYRFYASDMIHPNQTAIDYIWEKFNTVWVSESAVKTMNEVEIIQKGFQHKPFNPKSQAHQKFVQNLENKATQLQSQFPHIVF
ncbi:GSCFA domain-containing protein [Tamlana sp. 2201CG12-4]|uniref:GSCFA domain-containing protein n=1 Tax=Tamlana sp. 2201CG12-4 TaxID=3112582 RepID=UPI002DC03800|nr:GSCFA domain-containing protein [Tamlana sp. 2201CG12-4]MEC3905414.1 GSCFA domain-containing protein [Tamlana sp. 2201CG12-4]